jgi:hypothetical protein
LSRSAYWPCHKGDSNFRPLGENLRVFVKCFILGLFSAASFLPPLQRNNFPTRPLIPKQQRQVQPKRTDRLSPGTFEKRHAIVSAGDNTKNHLQVTITAEGGYSVIRDVVRWETGGIAK